MTLAVILVLSAVLALVVVLRVAVGSRLQIRRMHASSEVQPLDIDAFRNLADPAEDDYLRARLIPSEYRRVQRLRLRALAAYVQIAGQNAALLVRMGQSALDSVDPRTANAAHELINEALLLRRNAIFAMLRIYIAWTWPNAGFAAASLLSGYQQLAGSAMLLGRLQNPADPVRISVSW
jgi:hypothetical protein